MKKKTSSFVSYNYEHEQTYKILEKCQEKNESIQIGDDNQHVELFFICFGIKFFFASFRPNFFRIKILFSQIKKNAAASHTSFKIENFLLIVHKIGLM